MTEKEMQEGRLRLQMDEDADNIRRSTSLRGEMEVIKRRVAAITIKCHDCGRSPRLDENIRYGPTMWHDSFFMCYHERPMLCRECSQKRLETGTHLVCSKCGCDGIYT